MRTHPARLATAAALVVFAAIAVLAGRGLFASPASAQGFPPNPPTVYYGTVPSTVSTGAGIIAIVESGSGSAVCGAGRVLTEGGQKVYAVQVITESQTAGCGESGRTIRFYATPSSPTTGGNMLGPSTSWADCLGSGDCTKQNNLTSIGEAFERQGTIPLMASDGASF